MSSLYDGPPADAGSLTRSHASESGPVAAARGANQHRTAGPSRTRDSARGCGHLSGKSLPCSGWRHPRRTPKQISAQSLRKERMCRDAPWTVTELHSSTDAKAEATELAGRWWFASRDRTGANGRLANEDRDRTEADGLDGQPKLPEFPRERTTGFPAESPAQNRLGGR
jgi:hypothetical protein